MSMVFQDPMTALNPVMRIGNQITESLNEHIDLTRSDAEETALEPAPLGGHPRAGTAAASSTPTSCPAACASA